MTGFARSLAAGAGCYPRRAMRNLGVLIVLALACSGSQKPAAPAEDSVAHFRRAAVVLEHARCQNCHPSGDSPRWGEEGGFTDHAFFVDRGPADHGPHGLPCSTCHGAANVDAAGVPGAPDWALAPRAMGWVGLGQGELCRSILDRSRNGNRDLAALVHHMTEDALVAWAWQPGLRPDGTPRQPPPLARDEFNAAIRDWARTGARCPD